MTKSVVATCLTMSVVYDNLLYLQGMRDGNDAADCSVAELRRRTDAIGIDMMSQVLLHSRSPRPSCGVVVRRAWPRVCCLDRRGPRAALFRGALRKVDV